MKNTLSINYKHTQILTRSILGLLILLSTLNGFATNPEDQQDMYIQVKNVKSPKGSILIAIYDNENDYMKIPAFSFVETIDNKGEVKIQTHLPFGNYAITLFHDVNNNMELDTNLLGIPKEPYGFSNNAKAPFGPPIFDRTLFEFKEKGQQIEIVLK